MFKRLLGICWLLLALIPAAQAAKAEYQLGAGDVVRVSIYDHPDLGTELRIAQQGTVQFPLLGEVAMQGLTASEAADRLAKLLSDGGFVKNPQVTVTVTTFRGQQISVLGQVSRPGKYPVEQPSTVADMIAAVGGITPTAADKAYLLREGDKGLQRRELDLIALFENADNGQNPPVQNGDIIYVPREPRFYIYGEAQRPGVYRLERKMTVMQALALAGGLTQRGTESRIKINRRDEQGVLQKIKVKLDDLVQADDVLYISESIF